ncbi:capsule synthesis protein [Asticcacaulis sp. AC460]|uniref:CapA family protein n=1 Tax=Asticcacaulis sp. AC460 TaxID=1282360 RepID=UPI0003C3AFFC|nr:CapA family protein [Asticcacaulis sp. AC460]ESQ89236.1 capsule synthesis protein [Asticcacaulis sp. AC460]
MTMRDLTLMFTGDLVLDVPDADYWLSGIASALRTADVAIGHLEVPHTLSEHTMAGDVPAPGAPPENLDSLNRAGFTAVTLAGNHIADCGPEGIADTRAGLDRVGVLHTGAGKDLDEAARPVIIERGGRRIALLSYNLVGPEMAWAGEGRAGSNYLRVETADGSPIAPSAALERFNDHQRLTDDIAAVEADLIVVALHKGIVHTPAKLAPYERPAAQAAIDAGADVVIGHHPHIARGIEIYRGKPIFHGLGNGCVVTHALSPGQDNAARAAWVERRKALFGFEPDPTYTLAPFHPEAVNALIGKVVWRADGTLDTDFLPVFIEPPGRPVLATGERAQSVRRYIADITVRAGLPPLGVLA